MKIIGKDNKINKRATCGECSSIIEYVPIEMKSYVHHDYGGGSDTIYYIDCPQCGNKVTVKRY